MKRDQGHQGSTSAGHTGKSTALRETRNGYEGPNLQALHELLRGLAAGLETKQTKHRWKGCIG